MSAPKCTRFWTMKNGKTIRICDMEDAHLILAIRMSEKAGHFMWGVMDEWGVDVDVVDPPGLEDLLEEADRRDIDLTFVDRIMSEQTNRPKARRKKHGRKSKKSASRESGAVYEGSWPRSAQ